MTGEVTELKNSLEGYNFFHTAWGHMNEGIKDYLTASRLSTEMSSSTDSQ